MKHRKRRVTPVLASWLIVLAFAASAPGLTIMEENWDDANDVHTYTTSLTGPGSAQWIGYSVDEDVYVVSPERRMLLTLGGGTGTDYGALFWTLDHEVDFWREGTGAVSVQASRDSTGVEAWLQLRDDGQVVAEGRHHFNDFNTYHPVTVEMDGDETAVDTVVFVSYRWESPSSVRIRFDNFLFTADYRVCSDPTHPKIDADMNQDCYITLADFAILGSNWLECTDPTDETCIQ